jgi:site-specific DNA recombinase
MKPLVPKPQRCAIYTRKSTEHNLDLEFNSLDAQREACEAYIKSQAHEGWRLVPDRYDDGGLSGASLDRPALQKLLADVRALARSPSWWSIRSTASPVRSPTSPSWLNYSTNTGYPSCRSPSRSTPPPAWAGSPSTCCSPLPSSSARCKGLWVGGPVPLGYRCIDKKLEIVPEEAEVVCTIRYLELGSMGALLTELDRQGIRTKINGRRDGRRSGGIRFGVGSLAHLLKNRFYIGEVVYRGEVHCGEHEPILARDLFEAVQARRAANVVARQLRLRGSAAPLTGRLFDDRGNRMSPTHANKRGVRYRYYVSHAILQNRKTEAGSVARIPAPEIETLVCDGVRRHLAAMGGTEVATPLAEGELIERHVARVIVKPQALEVCLVPTCEASAQAEDHGLDNLASCHPPTTITLPRTAPSFAAVKGIVHAPCAKPAMRPECRDALLIAIAKARGWIDDIRLGRIGSFAEIAEREGQGERHIRLLAPLAFLSPRIIAAIVDGSAPADLTVTGLVKALPYSWIEQEQRVGL